METKTYLPAEWHKQSLIQLTWPHVHTDWNYLLEEAEDCFLRIAREILRRQFLLVVAPDPVSVRQRIEAFGGDIRRLVTCALPTDDTWARDHAFLTLLNENGHPSLLDFGFNGWGLKYRACHDNRINRALYFREKGILEGTYCSHLDFVLEGGSIECDGKGTLLTTEHCLLANNRNDTLSKDEITVYLKKVFHLERVLWLRHGRLEGDDTDGHIDTLARFCPNDTLAYVKCTDPNDNHFEGLSLMEEELKAFHTLEDRPYRLLPLPMPAAIYDKENGERLPATYANFLVLNESVLYPTYNCPEDVQAGTVLAEAFPGREIVGIDCTVLTRQHGSLHCVTMQYPEGVYKQ